MASIARTNGVAITTSGTPEQFIGKTQKFLAVVIKNLSGNAQDISAEFGAEELVDLVNQLITNGSSSYNYGASIHAVQHNATGQLSYMLDGTDGGWTAALLQAAIRAAGTINSIDVSGTTVTDVGFKLALS